jgi:uncharacterized protein YecT (DUF1311 family)
MRRLILTLAVLAATPVAAQDIDCATAEAQQDLNWCAEQDWQAADADLNAAYRAAKAALESWDTELSPDLQGGAAALLDAQRAWVTFRDAACTAEGFPMRGGSAEPLLVYGCMSRLTAQRATDLWTLAEDLGG